MKLTAENVKKVTSDCLYTEQEIKVKGEEACKKEAIIVDGIIKKFGFNPHRLESHRQDVHDMLFQLPVEFRKSTGGGWSFLNACNTKDGKQWGEHTNMEDLFCLGMALGLVRCEAPRSLWASLPGGMPYYTILDK